MRGAGGGELETLLPRGEAEPLEVGLAQELIQHVLHLVRDVARLPHPEPDVVVGPRAALVVRVLDERLQPLELVPEQADVVVDATEERRLLHRQLPEPDQHERDGSRRHDGSLSVVDPWPGGVA